MSLTSRQARLFTVAGIAAAGLSGAVATGARAASTTLTYQCSYPLIGAQPLSVAITAALPSSVPSGTPTPGYAVTAVATASGDTKAGLDAVGATEIEGTATAGATVSGVGDDQDVSVPITIAPYTVDPSATTLTLDASGTTPSLTFDSAGTGTVKVSSLALNLTAKDSSGAPIALGSADDSDGDPNTFDVSCTLDPASQDTTLGSFAVS